MKIKFKVYAHDTSVGFEEIDNGLWGFSLNNGLCREGIITSSEFDLTRKQFTNFLDRKGNEIYEGDVVEIFPSPVEEDLVQNKLGGLRKFKVIWSKEFGAWVFDTYQIDDCNFLWFWVESKEVEVIGNVVENSNLISL